MDDKLADTSVPVHPLIARRWSPRALDPNGEVGDEALRAMLEAARWAPSSYNEQPWTYILAERTDVAAFAQALDCLVEGNQGWAGAAAVLMLCCMVTTNEKGRLPVPEYGTGLASANLVLQAVAEGVVAHQLGGFDREGAKVAFALPADVEPLTVIAVGTPGSPDLLDEERRAKELAPRKRIPLSETAFSGEWGKPAF